MNNEKSSNGSSAEFRKRIAESVFSGGYTIERSDGYKGDEDNSIPYNKYLATRDYDSTCRDISTPPYCGVNVR